MCLLHRSARHCGTGYRLQHNFNAHLHKEIPSTQIYTGNVSLMHGGMPAGAENIADMKNESSSPNPTALTNMQGNPKGQKGRGGSSKDDQGSEGALACRPWGILNPEQSV